MQLGTVLAYLYPDEPEPPANYEVVSGEIAYWNEAVLGPQPTQEHLQEAWRNYAVSSKRNEFARATASDMKDVFPELHSGEDRDDAIWGALITAFTNSANPRLRKMKDVNDKRVRGFQLVNAYRDDSTKTAEDILALRWEDQ